MLDYVGMTLTTALTTVVVNSLITFMDIRRGAKLVVAGIFGLWIGFAAAAAASGWIATSRLFTGVVAVLLLFLAVETNVTAIAAWNYFGVADHANAHSSG